MRGESHRYRLGTRTVASQLPLDGVYRVADEGTIDWTISVSRDRKPVAPRPFHRWVTTDGRPWMTFSRDGETYLLRVAHRATFRIDPAGSRLVVERPRTASPRVLQHLLLNQVWPLALSLSETVLHASAIELPEGALVLAGPGGAGKSTLAAALAAAGRPLVGDDAIPLQRHNGRWHAVPGVPLIRLWPDAVAAVFGSNPRGRRVAGYTSKRLIDAAPRLPLAAAPCPIVSLCLLSAAPPAAAPRTTPLSPRDALMALIGVAFQLDVADGSHQRRLVDDLADLVRAVPVCRVEVPRRFAALPATAAMLADAVRAARLGAATGAGPAGRSTLPVG